MLLEGLDRQKKMELVERRMMNSEHKALLTRSLLSVQSLSPPKKKQVLTEEDEQILPNEVLKQIDKEVAKMMRVKFPVKKFKRNLKGSRNVDNNLLETWSSQNLK